jgi:hypothetical protein
MFRLHYRTAWDDYFTTANPTFRNSQTYETRQTLSDASVYVSNCLFKYITSSNAGGALYCTSVTYLLIESTSFYSCKTSSQYGAIYFSNTGGQCVLHEVCGYDCYTTSSNQHFIFARIQVNNGISSKNYVNYSSITRCVSGASGSWHMLCLYNGKICCPSTNISLNKCDGQTIYFNPFIYSSSVTCSFLYTSLTDNIDTDCNIIHLTSVGAEYEFKSCNVLRNTQGSTNSLGTFLTRGNMMIKDCCILENNANNIFYQEYSSYTITVSNCTVDKTTYNRNLVIQNTITKSFIHALNHMSTHNCHSGYDSAGYLTPVLRSLSPSKKLRLYYSCRKCFDHSPLRDFFLLTCFSSILKLLPQ